MMDLSTKWTLQKSPSSLAAGMALSDALAKAKPVILEPIMKVEIVTPDKFYGDITGNLSSKRGQIEGMDERGQDKVVKAMVPLAEMFGYVNYSSFNDRRTCNIHYGIRKV